MSVYVDQETNPFGRMIMCHMFADTLVELHAMAEQIGMQRAWFQGQASFPHYDVAKSRRAAAIRLGAIEVDRRRGYEIRKALRQDPVFVAAWKEEVGGEWLIRREMLR